MESKNNGGLIVIIMILLIALLGVCGYVAYDKILTQKDVENNDNKEINNEVVDNENKEEIATNNYELFATNLKNQFSKYDSNKHSYLFVNSDFVEDGYEIYLNENQNLFVRYFNKELNTKYGEYKIADNVLSFYVVAVGQGGGNMLYFINEDGTVGSADTEYGIANNNITIKKDIGYKNIVSIIGGSFSDGIGGIKSPIFIDINGNIFSENLK